MSLLSNLSNEDKIAGLKTAAKKLFGGNLEANKIDEQFPGRRKDNPLSLYSSYTYNISLYMVTPDLMNKFITNGGILDLTSDQLTVVAQSGGINNTTQRRAITLNNETTAGLDFYIDDLTINTLMPGGKSGASVGTQISFKIYEPIGFNFLQELSRASSKLNAKSSLVANSKSQPNSIQQNYIIGIRFYGYDVNGELLEAKDVGAIERFMGITISAMKFKLDGKMVTYLCEGLIMAEKAAYGQINGVIKKQSNIVASTVGEALQGNGQKSSAASRGLAQILNEDGLDQKDNKLVNNPVEYAFEFQKNSAIPTSRLIDDAEFSKQLAPMASIDATNKATVKESFKAGAINTTSKGISIAAGQSIVNVIDNIIVKSRYISDALTQNNNEFAETESTAKPGTKELKWYSINPLVEIKGRDDKTQNWSYKITYQITEYLIPFIRTPFKAATSKYPGPYKLYSYWLTGENTEVIAYEQSYDNLFYTITPTSTDEIDSANSKKTGASAPNAPQGTSGNSDTTGGKQNRGSAFNDSVRAQLYSPGDQSSAKIKIMGDPDYLNGSAGINRKINSPTFDKFYGPGSTISPLAGQVFIQIIFNTASDYGENGVLDVSEKIQFYETDAVAKAGIKGLVYMVTQCDSHFSGGKFTQTLDCLMVPSNQLVTTAVNAAAEARPITDAISSALSINPNKTTETLGRLGIIPNSSAGAGQGGTTATDIRVQQMQSKMNGTYNDPQATGAQRSNITPTNNQVTKQTASGNRVADDDASKR